MNKKTKKYFIYAKNREVRDNQSFRLIQFFNIWKNDDLF